MQYRMTFVDVAFVIHDAHVFGTQNLKRLCSILLISLHLETIWSHESMTTYEQLIYQICSIPLSLPKKSFPILNECWYLTVKDRWHGEHALLIRFLWSMQWKVCFVFFRGVFFQWEKFVYFSRSTLDASRSLLISRRRLSLRFIHHIWED